MARRVAPGVMDSKQSAEEIVRCPKEVVNDELRDCQNGNSQERVHKFQT